MKTRYIFLTCCCLFWGVVVWGQTNLITNSDLESAACGDSPGDNCDHFHDCVTAWTITHGTPNYGATDCAPYPDNHHIQLICQTIKSEGVMTPVSLEPGCHQLFMKVRVAAIGEETIPTLRVSLDHGLQPWSELACQQIIPDTENTTFIYNDEISINNNQWQWIIIDFGISAENAFLDQLMITGLSDNKQVNLHIDCIYLYQKCEEVLVFTSPVNGQSTIEDGVYNSCSYILVEAAAGGTVNVPANADVNLNAADYIRILPGFRAQDDFHANLVAACTNPDDGFRPECYACPTGGGSDGGSLTGGNEGQDRDSKTSGFASPSANEPMVYPNPTNGIFEIEMTASGQDVAIYNLLGKLVYHRQAEGTLTIDASTWNKGVYIIEFNGKNKQTKSVKKLMIQ